ncbi:PRD domain-containing protein [Paenibacillus sp. N1-5-1-14]|uniref:BglG family transcription antiterminator n=1 Tax=Paenibacillus radicibacter TaxID=2972488 RepID=UPI002159AE29|nr:PRD domain-containing protein [Paenibacillus radicibacter]MCR8644849.1 PRD domain-containing protein [Paenibacillus radicibacter]
MSLSTRSRALLKKIVYSQDSQRVKDFASEFEVSERTIKYDLDNIRLWLSDQGIELQSKPNKGIWIECDNSIRIKLLESLDNVKEHGFLNQQERVRHIILDLLLQDSYMTIGDLTNKHDVSRNTILSDLVLVESFFGEQELSLERGRFGLIMIGSEKQRRYVLENVMQDLLDGNDMFQIVQGVVKGEQPQYLSPILERFLSPVQDVGKVFAITDRLVRETESQVGILLSDRIIIGVFIRLCIIIQRQHQSCESMFELTAYSKTFAKDNFLTYRVFHELLIELEDDLGFTPTEDSIWFVSLQAIGGASSSPNAIDTKDVLLPDAYLVTTELITKVTDMIAIDFQDDLVLFNNLFAHMSDKLTKYSYRVVEPNPILGEITSSYRKMFDAVKRACSDILGIYQVYLSDSDIGFIVLHFQTAYEIKLDDLKYRALVVCGTGRGTSQFLKTILETKIKNLNVVECCSIMELNKVMEQAQVDLVISIFPIQTDGPVVTVSPIPTKHDFQRIQTILGQIEKDRKTMENTPLEYKPDKLKADSSEMEPFVQDLIMTGFELSTSLRSRFKSQLTEERAEGLTLHILLMMNRFAFGTPYTNFEHTTLLDGPNKDIRMGIIEMLKERNLNLNEGEVQAILRYFM